MSFKNLFSSPWSPAFGQCLCFQGRSLAGWFLRYCQPQPQWGNQNMQVKRGVQLCGRSLPYTGFLQRLQIAVAQRLSDHRCHQALTLLIQVTRLQHSKIKIKRTWAVNTEVFEVGVGYLSYTCIFFSLGQQWKCCDEFHCTSMGLYCSMQQSLGITLKCSSLGLTPEVSKWGLHTKLQPTQWNITFSYRRWPLLQQSRAGFHGLFASDRLSYKG